ncbi:hypothetical protein MHJ94_02135 [Chryseobacterium taklimakanense]|uniref:hypothetical protein n=1 Tax=Chryseobacterium taklimakanense TaxID=536441 RepID=UPI001EF64D1F|nr:hypothetical protein [Chryseobacterium taklimakanense]MCG7280095.1 hypothetical protein [Chryseobacterium taklimakanense]
MATQKYSEKAQDIGISEAGQKGLKVPKKPAANPGNKNSGGAKGSAGIVSIN